MGFESFYEARWHVETVHNVSQNEMVLESLRLPSTLGEMGCGLCDKFFIASEDTVLRGHILERQLLPQEEQAGKDDPEVVPDLRQGQRSGVRQRRGTGAARSRSTSGVDVCDLGL